jgi:amino acid adenylation domain-containing protein
MELSDLMRPTPQETEAFWRTQLNGFRSPPSLPAPSSARDGTVVRTPCCESVALSRALADGLMALAEQHGLDRDTVFTGAWAWLLHSYNPGEKITFAVRFASRPSKSDQLWPVSVSVMPRKTVLEWCRQLDNFLVDLKRRNPVSDVDVHRWCEVPIEETLLETLLDLTGDERGLVVSHPLEIRLGRRSDRLDFFYRPQKFSPDLIRRLSLQFVCLLESWLKQSHEPLCALELLPSAERQKLLVEWNNTDRAYPPCAGLHALFEERAAQTPEAIALVAPAEVTGGAAIEHSYAEVNLRSNQLAHYLRQLGVGPDVPVGICLPRSIDMVLAVLAVIKAGGVYVPLDPNYPKERLTFMLTDTNAPVVLTCTELLAQLPRTAARVIDLAKEWPALSAESTANPTPVVTPDNLAYLIYTSGSTGQPKGVAMRQGPLLNLLHWQFENFHARPAARTLQFASLNFDVSFQEIFSTLQAGGTLVLVSDELRHDFTALLKFLNDQGVERLFLPFVGLKHLAETAVRTKIFPSYLKEIITAGEQLQITPAMAEFFRKLGDCTLENQYGPSETHVVTAFRLQGAPETWPALPSIGRPIANTKIFLLSEFGRPVPLGVPGELYIGGVCLARGYWNRPELTATKFVSNAFSNVPGARLYKTGDLARYRPDGTIEFLGRMDHQVKIRGFRVELGEIEAVLSGHPSIRESVVVAREQQDGDKQLVAYLVSRNGPVVESEVREFLRERLPGHCIPPFFVALDKLPLTPNGKVDRRALPAPEETVRESGSTKLPRTPLEMLLQLVFERFLHRRPIGIDVSFFELGGDSLQALRLIVEIERATGRRLPMGVLYQASTVEALATAIQNQSQPEWSALVPLQPHGQKPPLFLVHTTPGDILGYGNLIYHLGTDQPCFGFQSLGLNRPEEAHTSIEEMAAYYIALMRRQQPQGPYFIGGWCYGGIVAVEMAQQLAAAGQETALLALIETPAPAPSLGHLAYYARRLGCLLQMKPSRLKTYFREKSRYYRSVKVNQQMRFKRVEKNGESDSATIEEQNRLLEKLERIYHVNESALVGHRSRFYHGRVVLFNAAEQDPALVQDPFYGWRTLARNMDLHVIPGNHDTILMEPHVAVLARQLEKSLHEARSRISQPQMK